MKRSPKFTLFAALALFALALLFPEFRATLLESSSLQSPEAPSEVRGGQAGLERIGFRSERALDEHFAKHGSEFGRITREEYLRQACELRDAPVGGGVLEARRADGVITRFERRSGAFLAFNADRTLRTFFKPNDGLAYFERQLEREPER